MIRLALPGLVMVEAEFLAFEILTLSASWLSTTHLAAQSVVATVTALAYQVPFPVSIAASTRIANLIGATLADAAKMAAKVAMVAAVFIGLLNMILLSSLRNWIPQLFTGDEGVIRLVSSVLPLCAAFQLFDSLTANCNGILRGLGRQEIGGYVNLFAYYAVAMPISFGTGFGLGWGLHGLWAVSVLSSFFGGRSAECVVLMLIFFRVLLLRWRWWRRLRGGGSRGRVGKMRSTLHSGGTAWDKSRLLGTCVYPEENFSYISEDDLEISDCLQWKHLKLDSCPQERRFLLKRSSPLSASLCFGTSLWVFPTTSRGRMLHIRLCPPSCQVSLYHPHTQTLPVNNQLERSPLPPALPLILRPSNSLPLTPTPTQRNRFRTPSK